MRLCPTSEKIRLRSWSAFASSANARQRLAERSKGLQRSATAGVGARFEARASQVRDDQALATPASARAGRQQIGGQNRRQIGARLAQAGNEAPLAKLGALGGAADGE